MSPCVSLWEKTQIKKRGFLLEIVPLVRFLIFLFVLHLMGILNEKGVLVKHCGLTDGTNEVGLLEKSHSGDLERRRQEGS